MLLLTELSMQWQYLNRQYLKGIQGIVLWVTSFQFIAETPDVGHAGQKHQQVAVTASQCFMNHPAGMLAE